MITNTLLFLQEFNVLDTQPGAQMALSAVQTATTTFWLTASSLFLLLLLLLCLSLCLNQRHAYQRKLKAATATAYGEHDNIFLIESNKELLPCDKNVK